MLYSSKRGGSMNLQLQKICSKYNGVVHKDFPNYIISRHGEIYSLKRQRFLDKTLRKRDPQDLNSKYDEMVHIVVNNTPRTIAVHRLLATVFIPNPGNKDTVNHIDGNSSNNSLSNLEWMTQSENSSHAHALNLISGKYTKCVVSTIKYKEEYVATYSSLTEAAKTVDNVNPQRCIGLIAAAAVNNQSDKVSVNGAPYTSQGYVWRYASKQKKQYIQESVEYADWSILDVDYKVFSENTDYLITVDGRVYDNVKERWLTLSVITAKGNRLPYTTVSLRNGSTYKQYRVAKLVAGAYGKSYTKVDFIDGNICNCHLDNLCEKEAGTNSRPVIAYKLVWKDVNIEYKNSTREVGQLTGITVKAIPEIIIQNKDIPLQLEYTDTTCPYTRNGYVLRGLSKS